MLDHPTSIIPWIFGIAALLLFVWFVHRETRGSTMDLQRAIRINRILTLWGYGGAIKTTIGLTAVAGALLGIFVCLWPFSLLGALVVGAIVAVETLRSENEGATRKANIEKGGRHAC